ncbi:MAG: glycosyltransferase [Propionibacteriaceae bacterium]|jgi:glycosyltransferase involved in cell wall biosynthesis|nr:glycosyltransferase [Propionibacteriaceae bacterium]
MRVLQVNSVYGRGSTGRIAQNIHGYLLRHGEDSMVAFGRGERPDADNIVRIANPASVGIHVAGTRITDRHGFFSRAATANLIQLIEARRPDVLHFHNLHGYYLHVGALFEYLAIHPMPIVWTLHDCWPLTGHCTFFDRVGCSRWESECFECPLKNEYPSSLSDQSTRNFRDKRRLFGAVESMTLVTPSRWLASLVSRSILGSRPLHVIPNGIDTAVFQPRASSFRVDAAIDQGVMVLGVANIWDARKGLRDLLEVAERLDSKGKVVIVGAIPGAKPPAPPNVVFISQTASARDLAEVYSAADVFFNPTYEDNFPTTNLEAIACGTPVVTYATGGSPETLALGSGAVVGQGDIDAAMSALLVLAQEETLEKPGSASSLDLESMSRRYLDLYTSVVSEGDSVARD